MAHKPRDLTPITDEEAQGRVCVYRPDEHPPGIRAHGTCLGSKCMGWIPDATDPTRGYCFRVWELYR
jgi:hypothetical protein